ncbi:contact-dependent growth inhibition system immunity protein [Streptomyces sp. NBC_00069]|uniref:contact-dependent growth inhibition system immunity protein n=1 Tax=Streptomyces sp. NBC_00069 TaxID=2975639 RepID=UPI00324483C9|nr:contact-dependent growth inhibition system immunity protein [Streptomyces sp. NBC_00998]
MNGPTGLDQSLEELEGQRWNEPPSDATGLVKAIHALRRRPIGTLSATELARLIGQKVGLRWLLPLAVQILSDTAPNQARGGFYDDDLLTAVLTCGSATWATHPELATEVNKTIESLIDLSPYTQEAVAQFLKDLRQNR